MATSRRPVQKDPHTHWCVCEPAPLRGLLGNQLEEGPLDREGGKSIGEVRLLTWAPEME